MGLGTYNRQLITPVNEFEATCSGSFTLATQKLMNLNLRCIFLESRNQDDLVLSTKVVLLGCYQCQSIYSPHYAFYSGTSVN